MFLTFDEPALLSILERNYEVKRKTLVLAEPDLLRIAKDNCSTKWAGESNIAPGSAGADSGTYLRSGEFVRTLELTVQGEFLDFYSPAVSYRKKSGKSFGYGIALIRGAPPFAGPYKLLPAEFYTD